MSTIRAQVIGKTFTALPEHNVTNTFHFTLPAGLTDPLATEIVAKLANFYSTVSSIFSPVLTGQFEVKLFNLDDPPPRNPYHPGWGFNIVLPGGGGSGMPEEASICASVHAALPWTGRRRGRLYLGPLNTTVLDAGTASAWARINPSKRTTIANALEALRTATTGGTWVIWSEKDLTPRTITGGWIDDSFDTQRRRGHGTNVRNTWGLST